jgi:hypothetical protein
LALARNKLLSCLKKRDLLNTDKKDRSELIRLGELFAQEGRLSDSIDLLEKGEHVEGLNSLRERCVAEGDYFLFQRLTRILGDVPTSEDWIRLGDNAFTQGKHLFARSAYQEANTPEKLAQVEKLLRSLNENQTSNQKLLH